MTGEQIIEKGVVVETFEGKARIELTSSDNCEECSAKIICKPKDENAKLLEVRDPLGVKPGDKVTITIEGGEIFKASLKLYGIPLIILIAGIFFGNFLFSAASNIDLYSFLTGAALTVFYYVVLYFLWKSSGKVVLPVITFVKSG